MTGLVGTGTTGRDGPAVGARCSTMTVGVGVDTGM